MRSVKTFLMLALLALPLSGAWAATVAVSLGSSALSANGVANTTVTATCAPAAAGETVTFTINNAALGGFSSATANTNGAGVASVTFTAGNTVGVGTITATNGTTAASGFTYITLNKDTLAVNITVAILQAIEVNFDDASTEATSRAWTFSAPLGTQVSTPPPATALNSLGGAANLNVENKTVGVPVDLAAKVTAVGNWGPVITPAAWAGAPAANEFAAEASVDGGGFVALNGPAGAFVQVKDALAAGALTTTVVLRFSTPKSVTTISSGAITVTFTATLN